MATKLTHAPDTSDDQLAEQAAAHHNGNATLRVMSSLLALLRAGAFPWWSPQLLLERFPVADRMEGLVARPDLRQKRTTEITHLHPVIARGMTPQFQAQLIAQALASGAVTEMDVERAFDETSLVIYMDASHFWRLFIEQMPWDATATDHRSLIGALVELLLVNDILTHHAVLTAIKRTVWQESIPVALRAKIDEALLVREEMNPGVPFHAKDILEIVGHKMIAEHLPLTELRSVMTKAEEQMGFAPPKEPVPAPLPSDVNPHPTMAPPKPTSEPPSTAEENASSEIDDESSVEDLDEDDPDVAVALQSEGAKEPIDAKGDDTEVFRVKDLPRPGSTVADGAFTAAAEASPASFRGTEIDRSSSVGFSPKMMERFQPLIDFLMEQGPRPADLNVTPVVETALRGLLLKTDWPRSQANIRDAFVAFVLYMAPSRRQESELRSASPIELESEFFRLLIRVNPELVKGLQTSKPSRPVPPLKQSVSTKR